MGEDITTVIEELQTITARLQEIYNSLPENADPSFRGLIAHALNSLTGAGKAAGNG